MTNARLAKLISRIDPKVQGQAGNWRFSVQDVPAFVITDEQADRMRILVPAADAQELDEVSDHAWVGYIDVLHAVDNDVHNLVRDGTVAHLQCVSIK